MSRRASIISGRPPASDATLALPWHSIWDGAGSPPIPPDTRREVSPHVLRPLLGGVIRTQDLGTDHFIAPLNRIHGARLPREPPVPKAEPA
jgi:hypothetical protein